MILIKKKTFLWRYAIHSIMADDIESTNWQMILSTIAQRVNAHLKQYVLNIIIDHCNGREEAFTLKKSGVCTIDFPIKKKTDTLPLNYRMQLKNINNSHEISWTASF